MTTVPQENMLEGNAQDWFYTLNNHYTLAQIYFHLNNIGFFKQIDNYNNFSISNFVKEKNLNEKYFRMVVEYAAYCDNLFSLDEDYVKLTSFGREVLSRFRRGKDSYNFFDVRVGCYGPVWQNLTQLMENKISYGVDLKRRGDISEKALFKLAIHFWPAVNRALIDTQAKSFFELGINTGLLLECAKAFPELYLGGIDRDTEAIDHMKNLFQSEFKGHTKSSFLGSDIFDADNVCNFILNSSDESPKLIFSVHWHEFVEKGISSVIDLLREYKKSLKGHYLLLLEHPKLLKESKEKYSQSEWLNAQSHVLIHHISSSGQILTEKDWLMIGKEAGCSLVSKNHSGYLNFISYLFQF